MSLGDKIAQELQQLVGFNGPGSKIVTLTEPQLAELAVDLMIVDSLSCSFHELRINAPHLVGASVDTLRDWADALSQRITYLLENLGPIEIDTQAGQVLVRSNPPDQQPAGAKYYEVLLQSDTSGNFSLRRFEAEKGAPGRIQVDIQTTHEVLRKLVDDLIDTLPRP